MIFRKVYQVRPNTVGVLYRANVFVQVLPAGIFKIWDWKNQTELFCLPTTLRLLTITNQEVLTKDNVALRFSFIILYRIVDAQKFLSKFAIDKHIHLILHEAEQRLHNIVQISTRNKIAEFDSESLNEKRNELANLHSEEIEKQVAEFGITIEQAQLRDLTFPKSIQDLFAKHLEAKIRAKSELENARTAVATARALKNASELMKDDDNIRFFQILETINKIAEKGKHTFMIGDINQLTKK